MTDHASERCRAIAEENTILRAVVGSALYGTTIEGSADRDEMGICIEPPSCVVGLEPFEQYEYNTAAPGERSRPGDLDLTVYSLRKWARMAAEGRPHVLQILFARDAQIDRLNFGGLLQERYATLFVTRQSAQKYSTYLFSQSMKMQGKRGNMTNRPELIEAFGFDTKFAYHAVRVGLQGVELMQTGKITYPVPEPDGQWLKDLRVGKHSMTDALERIGYLQAELSRLEYEADLPSEPDWPAINAFLSRMYREWWAFNGVENWKP